MSSNTQPGEKRPVTGPQRRASHPTTQDRHLVAKHNDFDGQLVIVTPKEPGQLENPDERQVQKGQRHSQVWSPSRYRRKSRCIPPDDIFGTHRPSTAP